MTFPCSAGRVRPQQISSSFLPNPIYQTWLSTQRKWTHFTSLFSLSFSLMSPRGIGVQSDLESTLTRGANNSMARSSTSVCWNNYKHCTLNVWKEVHTSQFSRIRQRVPATDLSGTKPLVVSLTPWSNEAVADKADLRFRSPSCVATDSLTTLSG